MLLVAGLLFALLAWAVISRGPAEGGPFMRAFRTGSQRGLVVLLTCGTYGNVIRLLPPLVISDDLLDEGITVLADVLRATGVLCVYGSGFGTRPEDGFFRVVFLANPGELSDIYDLVGEFTRDFLSRG